MAGTVQSWDNFWKWTQLE